MLRAPPARLFAGFVALDVVADAPFFGVQTRATMGYGAMYPKRPLAHALATASSTSSRRAPAGA